MEVEAVDEGDAGQDSGPGRHCRRGREREDRGPRCRWRGRVAAASASGASWQLAAADACGCAMLRLPSSGGRSSAPARRDHHPPRRRAGADDASVEVPAGTEMVPTTVREALRDAMAEEMRRDGNVFVMGEEVAEYQGAYKVTQGLLQEFGARRVVDTPITEHGFAGLAVGAALRWPAPDRRVHDLQLRHAGDRPHHQLGRQDALHVRRTDGLPDRVPRPRTAPRPASRPSTARTTRPGTRRCPA
jgi:pyruvate dehydrogenase E1 component beta subunit